MWSKTVLNLVMSCFIYHWPSYVPLLLLQELHITSLQVSHKLKNNSFSLTQQKHFNWIYLDIAAFQDFKASLLLPHACEEFAGDCITSEKWKKNCLLNCKFEFRLNCKQRLMFHQGTINYNKFMSVDATQFCLCRNPTNCLLSMNKSAHRCTFCQQNISGTHTLSCENGHRPHNISGFLCFRTYQKRSWNM